MIELPEEIERRVEPRKRSLCSTAYAVRLAGMATFDATEESSNAVASPDRTDRRLNWAQLTTAAGLAKTALPIGNENAFTHRVLRELELETVCENVLSQSSRMLFSSHGHVHGSWQHLHPTLRLLLGARGARRH